jgi:hypothetical protein
VSDELDRLVARADLDGLVAHVDSVVAARDWELLIRVRDASHAAVATGRQLWPAATYANHCLALRAPGEHAVRALDDVARSFMIGPVSEILAVGHTWDELAEHLPPGLDRTLVAHERAMRGDPGGADEPALLEVPIVPLPWEPTYAVADYDEWSCHAPAPPAPDGVPEELVCAPMAATADTDKDTDAVTDEDLVDAFRQLVEPWTAGSNGRADIAVVEGDLADAFGCLGLHRVRLRPVDASAALAALAWAGASGGAHGRRRGAAMGRFGAWWMLAAIGGVTDEWPLRPDTAAEIASEISWHAWDAGEPDTGWSLRLAVFDPADAVSCAMSAVDVA